MDQIKKNGRKNGGSPRGEEGAIIGGGEKEHSYKKNSSTFIRSRVEYYHACPTREGKESHWSVEVVKPKRRKVRTIEGNNI